MSDKKFGLFTSTDPYKMGNAMRRRRKSVIELQLRHSFLIDPE
jgi:hypothetical protein